MPRCRPCSPDRSHSVGPEADRIRQAHHHREIIRQSVRYIDSFLRLRRPLTDPGICFGHQIVALVLGGQIEIGEWELSVTNIRLTSIGRAIFRADELVRPSRPTYMRFWDGRSIHVRGIEPPTVPPARGH